MRVVLDACVLFPTVLREILLGLARTGLYEPVWTERILREWVLATARIGREATVLAEGDAALARTGFPRAIQAARNDIEAKLVLPDPNDTHVLAAAIAAHADAILTFNAQDFPRTVLAEWGIERRDPDGFLWEMYSRWPAEVTAVVEGVRAEAERLSGEPVSVRSLMKRLRLHRFGRALAQSQ